MLQVHRLVQQLPNPNTRMLEMLLSHLANIVVKCDKNLMTVANLGVCFGRAVNEMFPKFSQYSEKALGESDNLTYLSHLIIFKDTMIVGHLDIVTLSESRVFQLL